MIFYFSGTGNSHYLALKLAQELGEKTVDIANFLPLNEKASIVHELSPEEPIIVVAPVYAWRMPRLVSAFLEASSWPEGTPIYFILSCGDSWGDAAFYARRLAERLKLRFMGLYGLVMPENYIALFPCPERAEAEAIIARAEAELIQLIPIIQEREAFPEQKSSWRLLSHIVNPLFYPCVVSDRGFSVDERCIHCGLCVGLCPLQNISLTEDKKRPQWHGDCTHCMACIAACPTEAIVYKGRTRGKTRYYLEAETGKLRY